MKKLLNPKLYRLLEQLEGRELPWFDKFLASPYFNSSPWPQKLWACLRPAHPRYDALSKEEVFEQLSPGKPFDAKFLNSRFSELSRLVEEFFYQQEFRREETPQRRARRLAYRNRGLYSLYSRESRRQAAHLLDQPYRSPGNLAEILEIFDELYLHPESKSHNEEGADISRAMELLGLHFVLLKLKYGSDQLARQVAHQALPDNRFLDAVLKEAPAMEGQHPAIDIYYRLVTLFREDCPDEGFRNALHLFFRRSDVLPKDERSFILAKFVTLAFRNHNQGRQDYLEALYRLFQYGDEQGLFIFHGAISDATFLNVCTVASQTGHFDWAEQFIRSNKAFLPAAAVPDAIALGKAIVSFARKDYSTAYHLLNEVYKNQSAYKLRVHSLYVRCLLGTYLEDPREDGPLWSALDAFGQYIRRHKSLSAQRKKEYLNFARAAKKIALLRAQAWHSSRARTATLKWVEQLQPLALGSWLRKQLEKDVD